MHALFVYGTLRRPLGHPMHALLARHAVYTGAGHTAGRLYDLGSYPALTHPGEEDARVYGEVYTLTAPGALAALDRYEGFDPGAPDASLYIRAKHPVAMDDGRTVAAWVYVYRLPIAGRRRIASGDYVAYLRAGDLRDRP